MAASAKFLSVFFLLFFISSSQTEARSFKFFTKLFNPEPPRTKSSAPASAPAFASDAPAPASDYNALTPAPAPIAGDDLVPTTAPTPAPVNPFSGNNYGLYGHGQGTREFLPNKETGSTINNMENEFLEDDEEDLDEEMEKAHNYNGGLHAANNYYGNVNSHDELYARNYDNYANHNKFSKGYTRNFKRNNHQAEQQGMSDTRFLENGKYYYHVNNENDELDRYANKAPPHRDTASERFYGSKSPYEFDTMEEYENQERNGKVNTRNEGLSGSKTPYEFDTMEEYEKQQQNNGKMSYWP